MMRLSATFTRRSAGASAAATGREGIEGETDAAAPEGEVGKPVAAGRGVCEGVETGFLFDQPVNTITNEPRPGKIPLTSGIDGSSSKTWIF